MSSRRSEMQAEHESNLHQSASSLSDNGRDRDTALLDGATNDLNLDYFDPPLLDYQQLFMDKNED